VCCLQQAHGPSERARAARRSRRRRALAFARSLGGVGQSPSASASLLRPTTSPTPPNAPALAVHSSWPWQSSADAAPAAGFAAAGRGRSPAPARPLATAASRVVGPLRADQLAHVDERALVDAETKLRESCARAPERQGALIDRVGHAVRDDDGDSRPVDGTRRPRKRLVRDESPPPVPVPDNAELVVAAANLSTIAPNARSSLALAAFKSALARTVPANVVYETRSWLSPGPMLNCEMNVFMAARRSVALAAFKSALARTLLASVVYETRSWLSPGPMLNCEMNVLMAARRRVVDRAHRADWSTIKAMS
jgi:hypothetical protein